MHLTDQFVLCRNNTATAANNIRGCREYLCCAHVRVSVVYSPFHLSQWQYGFRLQTQFSIIIPSGRRTESFKGPITLLRWSWGGGELREIIVGLRVQLRYWNMQHTGLIYLYLYLYGNTCMVHCVYCIGILNMAVVTECHGNYRLYLTKSLYSVRPYKK